MGTLRHVCALVIVVGCGTPMPVTSTPAATSGDEQVAPVVAPPEAAPPLVAPLTTTQLALAEEVACALHPARGLFCWGRMMDGSNEVLIPRATPIDAGRELVRVAAAGRDVCALTRDGAIHCLAITDAPWLSEANGFTDARGVITAPVPAVELAVGSGFVCALLVDGRVGCAGFIGSTSRDTCAYEDEVVPCSRGMRLVAGVEGATALVSGSRHACALTRAGDVMCWGDDAFGQLGAHDVSPHAAASRVSGLSAPTHITSGRDFACVRTASGEVLCWGAMRWHTRDAEREAHALVRSPVPALTGATSINADGDTLCGVIADGVRCVLRPEPPAPTRSPSGPHTPIIRPVGSGPSAFVAAFANTRHVELADGVACFVADDGAVMCRGQNTDGLLGDPWAMIANTPTLVIDGAGNVPSDAARLRAGRTPWTPPERVAREGAAFDFAPVAIGTLSPDAYVPDPTSVPSLVRAGFAVHGDLIRGCLVHAASTGPFRVTILLVEGEQHLYAVSISMGALEADAGACITSALRDAAWPRLETTSVVNFTIAR